MVHAHININIYNKNLTEIRIRLRTPLARSVQHQRETQRFAPLETQRSAPPTRSVTRYAQYFMRIYINIIGMLGIITSGRKAYLPKRTHKTYFAFKVGVQVML